MKSVDKLVIRIGQLGGERPRSEPSTVAFRTVKGMFGGVPLCARHAYELAAFLPDEELRAVLSDDKIEALVNEFGLRRQDMLALHGLRIDERCAMCGVHPNTLEDGSPALCYNDRCCKPLHPEWPAVYCSDDCAAEGF